MPCTVKTHEILQEGIALLLAGGVVEEENGAKKGTEREEPKINHETFHVYPYPPSLPSTVA